MELTDAPSLPAIERPWAPAFREGPALREIVHALGGGPFHVIHPGTFAGNLNDIIEVLATRGVSGTVYYGKKANKAAAWMRECLRDGAGVDVASVPEFVDALANGVRGKAIGVTGAAKSNGLLFLGIRHGALIAIDTPDELERLPALAAAAGDDAQILLRVRPPTAPNSRFGFDRDSLRAAIGRCAEFSGRVHLRGFSFHLDGYAVAPRAELAAEVVDLCLQARASGHDCDRISIGGGLASSYVAEQHWEPFRNGMDSSWFHAGRTPDGTYPYFQAPTGAAMVEAILDHATNGASLSRRLRDAGMTLLLEPGRALVDGAGFSVFPVQGYESRSGYGITTVAGLSMSVSEQWKGREFLPDPLLVRKECGDPAEPVRTAVAGASCMEYDMLTWRAVSLPSRPAPGDLLVYPNTAGYQMDKNESEFHQLPLPPKVVVDDDLRWRLDSRFPIQEVR